MAFNGEAQYHFSLMARRLEHMPQHEFLQRSIGAAEAPVQLQSFSEHVHLYSAGCDRDALLYVDLVEETKALGVCTSFVYLCLSLSSFCGSDVGATSDMTPIRSTYS
jgi:hypothetical protein